MIMDEFDMWKERSCESAFKDFASTYIHSFFSSEEMMKDLLFQVYQLQVCVEGLIQDQENSHEKAKD